MEKELRQWLDDLQTESENIRGNFWGKLPTDEEREKIAEFDRKSWAIKKVLKKYTAPEWACIKL